MRDDRRAFGGLEALQLARSRNEEAPEEQVEHSNGEKEHEEEGRGDRDHNDHLRHREAGREEPFERVRDGALEHIHVFREAVQDAARRRRIEERHGRAHYAVCTSCEKRSIHLSYLP